MAARYRIMRQKLAPSNTVIHYNIDTTRPVLFQGSLHHFGLVELSPWFEISLIFNIIAVLLMNSYDENGGNAIMEKNAHLGLHAC